MTSTTDRAGRNDPCPCGSGRKYKQCCLDKDEATARVARDKAAKQAAKDSEKAKPAPATSGEKDTGAPSPGAASPGVRRSRSNQPWKKSRGSAHPTQRKSLPRKVGSG